MKKRVLAVALAAAMVGSLAACSTTGPDTATTAAETEAATEAAEAEAEPAEEAEGEAEAEAASGGPYKFGYTCMDGTNPFFVTIQEKMKELVEANGDELIITDPGNDVTKQISQVEDMLSQDLDGLLTCPIWYPTPDPITTTQVRS